MKDTFQAFLYEAIPLVKKLGITIDELTHESVLTRLPEEAFNRNHFNTVYAGIQFTIMEVTGGIIFAFTFDPKKFFMVVNQMTIEYHKPAKGTLSCRCEFPQEEREQLMKTLEQHGKAETTLCIELLDADDQVVSKAHALYYVSPMKEKR